MRETPSERLRPFTQQSLQSSHERQGRDGTLSGNPPGCSKRTHESLFYCRRQWRGVRFVNHVAAPALRTNAAGQRVQRERASERGGGRVGRLSKGRRLLLWCDSDLPLKGLFLHPLRLKGVFSIAAKCFRRSGLSASAEQTLASSDVCAAQKEAGRQEFCRTWKSTVPRPESRTEGI